MFDVSDEHNCICNVLEEKESFLNRSHRSEYERRRVLKGFFFRCCWQASDEEQKILEKSNEIWIVLGR